MADRRTVTVTGDPDDLGRQTYTTAIRGRIVELHGYPCDEIASLQSEGHDVLVIGEVRILPFGKYRHPEPMKTPEGMLYPAMDPPLWRPATDVAPTEPSEHVDRAQAITARLDRLEQGPRPEPPNIVD